MVSLEVFPDCYYRLYSAYKLCLNYIQIITFEIKTQTNYCCFWKPVQNVSKIQFSHLSPDTPPCDKMINVALRQAPAQPMTPWHIARPTTHLSITSTTWFCHRHQERNTFSTCFYFPWEQGELGVEAALGWRCANGERVHSPTHPFPVLSRSIIVERWRWEPRSLPTPPPAAPPSAAAKQPPATPVYPPIYTSLHTSIYSFIHPSVHKESCGLQRSCCLL